MYAELERNICKKCGIAKEKKEFGKDAAKAKGITEWCKVCKSAYRTKNRKDNPEAWKKRDLKSDLKKLYGMSVETYEFMRLRQNGRCACCGEHESKFKRRLNVDHCHQSGEIRSLLCQKCNPGLGYFDDSVKKLQMAITYLKKFKK